MNKHTWQKLIYIKLKYSKELKAIQVSCFKCYKNVFCHFSRHILFLLFSLSAVMSLFRQAYRSDSFKEVTGRFYFLKKCSYYLICTVKLITENDWCQKKRKNQRLVSDWFTPRLSASLGERGEERPCHGGSQTRERQPERWNPLGSDSADRWLSGGQNATSGTKLMGHGMRLTRCKFTENKTSHGLGSRQ